MIRPIKRAAAACLLLCICCTGCTPQSPVTQPTPTVETSIVETAKPVSSTGVNANTPVPTPSPTPEPTSALYANENLGFTLEFPASWSGHYIIYEYDNGIAVNFLGESDVGKYGFDGDVGDEITGTEFFDIQADFPEQRIDRELDVTLIGVVKGIGYYIVTSTDDALSVMDIRGDVLAQADYQLAREMKEQLPDLLDTFRMLPLDMSALSSEKNAPLDAAYRLTLPVIESVHDMIHTDDGGVLLLGQISSINVHGLDSNTAWAAKVDKAGNQQWSFESQGDYPHFADAVQTSDGGYVLLKQERMYSSITKLSIAGEDQWSRMYSSHMRYLCSELTATPDGGFLLLGQAIDEKYNCLGLAIKVDDQGKVVWERTYEDAGIERFTGGLAHRDGGYVLVGDTVVSDTYEGWAGRIDEAGDIVWKNQYGGKKNERLQDIAAVEGGYLLSGFIMAQQSYDREGAWALKIDDAGGVIWESILREDFDAEFVSVFPTADGGGVFAGNRSMRKPGNKFAWVVRFDAEGTLLWEQVLDEEPGSLARSIVATTGGDYVLGGGVGYTTLSGHHAGMGWVLGLCDNK